jgi:hypothetical protein
MNIFSTTVCDSMLIQDMPHGIVCYRMASTQQSLRAIFHRLVEFATGAERFSQIGGR